ncbi:heat-inducible transcriptional repressor HrcA [Chlamydia avium]|nr:heat-inducible transcriptional repressor HrcA [Chlamydia avium]
MSKPQVSKRDSKILYILLTATELYLKTGQPVGSKTFKEYERSNLSTATIRNYFSKLEAEGFLKKNHISGGRIPTDLAFRYYVDHCANCCPEELPESITHLLNQLPEESRNIVKDLQKASELLGEALQLPICFSSPRFENDAVTNVQLTQVDEQRVVVILSTEFGQVFTDTLWLPEAITSTSLKRIEDFLQKYIKKLPLPTEAISQKEEGLGMILYNEIVIRYLTHHCNFSEEDLYQTGLSKLLQYESFKDPDMLALGLSFFENRRHMSKLLDIGMHRDRPTAFIGSELSNIFGTPNPQCTVITTPYYMNRTPLGAFGVLGPMNLPYKEIYNTLLVFADKIKSSLTKSFYKFKLSFRRPCPSDPKLSNDPILLARYSSIQLLPPKETA